MLWILNRHYSYDVSFIAPLAPSMPGGAASIARSLVMPQKAPIPGWLMWQYFEIDKYSRNDSAGHTHQQAHRAR